MEDQKFVENFAAQFEEVDPSSISLDTRFRDVEGWSSFAALSIIAMVDEVYNIKLTGKDIRKANTVKDILSIVESKM
jgi:acyl carrier protein